MKNVWANLKSNFSNDPNEDLLIIGSDIPFYHICLEELADIRDLLTFVLDDINQHIEKGAE